MKIRDSLNIATVGVYANKGRSALAILGIVIGVAAVIAMIAVGEGAERLVISQIASLGSNNIFIEPGTWSKRMERGSMMQSMLEEFEIKTLKYEDAQAIARLPNVEMIASLVYGVDRVVYGNNSKKITFFGATPEAEEVTDIRFVYGRGLADEDVKSMARVVVLGYDVAEELFGKGEDPVGKVVRIKKTNFRVVGVMEEKGPQAFLDLNGGVFLPITTAQKLLLGIDYIRHMIVRVQDGELIDQTSEETRLLLRERHGIFNPEGDLSKDDFKVMSQKEAAQVLGSVTSIFTVLLSSIAAISLLVGGIGIMNIMLVSVTERTREVGLRKAVGAREKDILTQFLLESVILTLSGGILGIIFGALLSSLTSLIFAYFLQSSWGFLLPFKAVILGVGVSTGIGVMFGIYPAHKAAKLSPVDALRYE